MSPLLQTLHRITQLPHPVPNPSPHLLAHPRRDIRRIKIGIHQLPPPRILDITLLHLLRRMRLRRRRNVGRVEAVHSEQVVKRVTRGLAVRGGVDGGAGGAVCGNFEFVFGGFVAVSLVRFIAFLGAVKGREGREGGREGSTYSSWSSSTRRSAWDFPVEKGLVLVNVGRFLRVDRVGRGGGLKGWVDRDRRWMDGVMEARRREGRGLARRVIKRRFDRLSRREVIFV